MTSVKNVIIVAPVKLKQAFHILLHPTKNLRLLVFASSLQELAINTIRDEVHVIILFVTVDNSHLGKGRISCDDARIIQSHWPNAFSIAFVERTQQQAEISATGADAVLIEGTTPQRLLEVIEGGIKK